MTSNPCLATSRKRKRSSELHVRFSTQPQSIIYTYSQSDYDRSGLFSDNGEQKIIFALAINFVHPSSVVVTEPKKIPAGSTEKPKKKLNKRPKLSIDTSNLHGPLYFTNLTTNHQKKQVQPTLPLDEEMDIVTRENTRRNSLPLVA